MWNGVANAELITLDRPRLNANRLIWAVWFVPSAIDGGVVAGHPLDVVPVARARRRGDLCRGELGEPAVETDPAQPVHVHVADAGELGVGGLLDRRHRRLTGRVDGLAQVDVPGENDGERVGDLGVVEDPFDPGLAGFGDELDLALVRRGGDVAEPVAAAGARCHLDRGQPLEQVDEADGEPVDLLGRVEAVVVVLDEAAEPGAPRARDRVAALDEGLQPGFDLAVIRAGRGWWGRGRLRGR